MEGRSLLELLAGSPPSDWREGVYFRNRIGPNNWYGLRTDRYKLIRHDRVKEWELIDLLEDPHELTNVHDEPQYASVVEDLQELLAAVMPDQDHDGVGDPRDNCIAIANADQRDTDLDGFGNRCDGDFDDNLVVNALDLGTFNLGYLKQQGDPLYSPDLDLDGNGIVNAIDRGIFRATYLRAPGPSGRVCAGKAPCL
jgi:hypothetical protein